jgi:hypothetical protein
VNRTNPGKRNHHIVIEVIIGMKKLSVHPTLKNSAVVEQIAIRRI